MFVDRISNFILKLVWKIVSSSKGVKHIHSKYNLSTDRSVSDPAEVKPVGGNLQGRQAACPRPVASVSVLSTGVFDISVDPTHALVGVEHQVVAPMLGPK